MKLLSIIILSLTTSLCFATQQTPDNIVYKGETYCLEPFIFEQYFENHPEHAPEKSINSGLWRGFTTSFIITNNILVLDDIEGRSRDDENDQWKSLKNDIYPNQEFPPMEWFTGILILGRGEEVPRTELGGFRILFANYILLEVNQGKITREKRLSEKQVKPFIDKQWDAYKKTDEYKNLLSKLKSRGYGDPEGDLRTYIILRDRIPRFYEE